MNEPHSRADAGRLAVLLLLASLLHGWLIAHTELLARDGTGFVRYALLLERRPWREVIAGSHQHPLYPLTILATSLPLRHWMGTNPETMRLSAQLAASVAGVLLVVPMYFLGRALFDRRVGFWAAVLFQCLPVTGRILSDALSDSLCLFLVASALYFGVRALKTASPWRFAFCGVCSGLAYLTRPEGILPVVPVGLVWLGMQLSKAGRSPRRRFVVCSAGLVLATLLVVGPMVAMTGRLSNKPAVQNIVRTAIPAASAPATDIDTAGPTRIVPALAVAIEASDDTPIVASATPDSPNPSLGRSVWALGYMMVRSFQWFAWLPALLGLWHFRARWCRQPEAWVLLLLCLLFGAALVRLNMVAGYLGERHAQILVMCGCFWAVAAVAALGQWVSIRWQRRWIAPALLAALTLVGVPVLAKPLHANQVGYRAAGLWLAEHSKPEDQILDWHNSSTYYAGRLCPEPGSGAPPITYAVVEEPQRNALPADVQRQIDQVVRQGKVVFRCPAESGRKRGQEIVIYANHPASVNLAAVEP